MLVVRVLAAAIPSEDYWRFSVAEIRAAYQREQAAANDAAPTPAPSDGAEESSSSDSDSDDDYDPMA